MYGSTELSTGGTVLAATGLATGAYALAGVGLILAGIALYMLFRKNGKDRP